MSTTATILATTLAALALPLAAQADGFYWNGDNATGALDDTDMWLYGGREDYALTATNALPTAGDDATVIGRTGKTSAISLASGHSFTAKNFYLGHGWGNVATLTTAGNVTIAGATEIGYYNDGHGTLIQNGGSWTTADLKMGTSGCTDSHLIVSNGTFTVNAGDGNPKIAESDNSQVELLIDGGAMVINGNPIFGHANGAQANVTVSSGSLTVNGRYFNFGNKNSSVNTMTVNGGEVSVDCPNYGFQLSAMSTVNLNGGTLRVHKTQHDGNRAEDVDVINFNGGVLADFASDASRSDDLIGNNSEITLNVLAGGVVIATDNNRKIEKAFAGSTGDGGFTKRGTGTLTLSATPGWNGVTRVEQGALSLAAPRETASYAVYPSTESAPLQFPDAIDLSDDTLTVIAEESELSEDVNYLLMTAQSITGTPTLSNNFEEPWYLQNTGSSLYLRLYHDGDDTNTYEQATLSYSKSAYDATTKTWTDDSYSVHSDIGVGGDSIWKISGDYKNTATYTISVPADAEVHYVTFLNTVEAYSNTGTVSVVSSGAVCTLSTNVIDDTKRDIVASISGHTAGTPISFTLTGLHTVMFDKIQIDYLVTPLETAPVLKSWKVTDTSDRNHFALMLSYDRVMTNATATVNGTKAVEAEPGSVLLFPVWDLAYGSTATVNISSNDVKDIYGNKIASNLTFAVEIGAKPTATKEAPFVVNDFISLSNAVAALNIENASATAARKVIYLRDGDYACESNRLFITGCNITFLGESTNVFIHGNTVLTSTTAPVQIEDGAKGIVFQNMVIRNDNTFRTGEFGGQSLAVKGGDHTVFDNVYLQSNQDTFLANGPLYYRGGEICGTVDFIYGDGNMFFTNTTLTVEDRKGNVILAPGTSPTVEWGIVLAGCTIDAAPGAVNDLNGTFTLGRPWKSEPRGYYINTTMKIVPSEGGWGGMSKLYTHMYEYGSVDAAGNPIDLSGRKSSISSLNEYYPVLTEEEAAKITCRNVLDGRDSWDPTEHLAEVAKPVLTVQGGRVSWTDDPYASCYIVLADGAFAAATTATSYLAPIRVSRVEVISLNASGAVGAKSDAAAIKGGLVVFIQ